MKKMQRNVAVLASYKRELSLNTRVSKDKSKYSRKEKHKNKLYVCCGIIKENVRS
ncbi:hypothetical protein [Campylobacter helveticus]|uniref:hypothetical protein n=1 Tax=Campylobacter helveticus TaxID=28898 RepID=UPI00214A69A1|nr:hypothetical protein [Campylobacter helveticus]MCR2056800.1 hypothetical protein [Campylobacter helveticus]MCR2062844.1 hypothetical protein [Campylobacter helveticus]MCR2064378.1 hypothetical protein [Campylobacter helveticus]MCR2066854.1 hypothetical protein [Campylobacter helveticus]